MGLEPLKKTENDIFNAVWTISQSFNCDFDSEKINHRIRQLTPEIGAIATRALSKFASILEEASTQKIDIHKNTDFFSFWLNKMNLRAPFEVENYIHEGDIVEVYDLDMVQICRNHTFYEFCSYDPLTLATTPFPVLFRRDNFINDLVVDTFKGCLSAEPKIRKILIPTHTMQEHYAKNSKVFKIKHGYCAALTNSETDKIMAIVCTQKAEQVENSNVFGVGTILDH